MAAVKARSQRPSNVHLGQVETISDAGSDGCLPLLNCALVHLARARGAVPDDGRHDAVLQSK